MNPVRTASRLIGYAAALALGACHSAATQIYGLDAVIPATHVDTYQAPALRVDTLNVPAAWDRLEILRPLADGKLQISDFDHWAAPLAQIARQTLSADLDQRLPAGSVIYPRLPKPTDALGINVDILEFTVDGPRTSMQVSWIIAAPGGSRSAKRGVAVLHGALASREPAALAHAWSELLGKLADHIAADAAAFGTP